jgi:hypothetical protein
MTNQLSFRAHESKYQIGSQFTRVTQIIISSSFQIELMHHLPIAGQREMIDVHVHQGEKYAHHAFASRLAAIIHIDALICNHPRGEEIDETTH